MTGSQFRQHSRSLAKLRLKVDLSFAGDDPVHFRNDFVQLQQVKNQLTPRAQFGAQQSQKAARNASSCACTGDSLELVFRLFCAIKTASRASPWSSCFTMVGVAPFCGPNTAAAPLGPVRGLSTSQATRISTRFSAGCRRFKSIFSIASRSSTTVPNRFAMTVKKRNAQGLQRSNAAIHRGAAPDAQQDAVDAKVQRSLNQLTGAEARRSHGIPPAGGTNAKPEARDISMTAVLPSPVIPYSAVMLFPEGPHNLLFQNASARFRKSRPPACHRLRQRWEFR